MNRLKGAAAIVTGGAVGIGRAACVRLAEEGAAVAVTDVREEEGQALAADIAGAGGTVAFWRLDVSQEAEVQQVFAAVTARFGPVTVLVNNAGIAGVNKPTHEITEAEWDALMAVNVKGVFFCTRAAVPRLQRRGVDDRERRPDPRAGSHPREVYPSRIHQVETCGASQATCRCARRWTPSIRWGMSAIRMTAPGARAPGVRRGRFITGSELVIDGGYTAQ